MANIGGIHTHAFEMGSGAIIYIPTFIKTGSATQKVIVGVHG
jgi:hypothetical protein